MTLQDRKIAVLVEDFHEDMEGDAVLPGKP
jgi:hypothetical protein